VRTRGETLTFRRELRLRSTDAENALWGALKAKRFGGLKFRRQHPVGRYILDLYCHTAHVAIEADGGQHFTDEGKARDATRTAYLASRGIDSVLEAIWGEVTGEGQRVKRST
jgi:very-short-patch-repair endonuclease